MSTSAEAIGARVFQHEDQLKFAQVSHDFNPMHMDPVAARRLISGQQVVHGVHLLLSSLEFWRPIQSGHLKSIACNFKNPVNVGDQILFQQSDIGANQSIIEGTVNGLICLSVTLSSDSTIRSPATASSVTEGRDVSRQNSLLHETSQGPLDESPDFHRGRNYIIPLELSDLSILFPRSLLLIGNARLSATLALSYAVGMVCPGLHSVFSSANIDLDSDAVSADSLSLSVIKYDERFRLFDLAYTGPIRGTIKAFSRPPPQLQPAVQDLVKYVAPFEFKGTCSLIIGASRGLGELTAKILATGAGNTFITYSSGHADACAISHEINLQSKSKCQVFRLNLNLDNFDSLALDWTQLNAVYYFATPKIFRKKASTFEPALFQEFYRIYVEKFYELCSFIEGSARTDKVKIYFPSTIAVEDRPKGMAEYAMAKCAAELLIHEINRTFTKVIVTSTRLPRLNTDQTATILNTPAESNIESLLPIIRALNS